MKQLVPKSLRTVSPDVDDGLEESGEKAEGCSGHERAVERSSVMIGATFKLPPNSSAAAA
jgi:hypothetical protein